MSLYFLKQFEQYQCSFFSFWATLKSENRGNNEKVWSDSFLPFLSVKLLLQFIIFIDNWIRYPVIGLPYQQVGFKLIKTCVVFTLATMVLISCEEEIQSEHI